MRNLVLIGTLIMSVMLFTSNPIEGGHRLYQAIWNLGHLVFFLLLTWLLLTQTILNKKKWLIMLLASVSVSLVLGGLIEVAQYSIGRYMELQDLLLDVLGGVLGFLVVASGLPQARRPVWLNSSLIYYSLVTAVILMALYPVFKIVLDGFHIKANLPIVANFESEAELGRWGMKHVSHFEIDEQLFSEGESSLFVQYTQGEYPAVTLEYLAANWLSYVNFNFSIHNDQQDELLIELKIFDRVHRQNGYAYDDRYNQELLLKPGWNEFQIPLIKIYKAPLNRDMDLQEMSGISLFINKPDEPKSIHLDNFYLSK